MLAVGRVSVATTTVTAAKVTTSAAERTTFVSRRTRTMPTAKKTNAATGHVQRSVWIWNVPNTVSGDRAAVTTPRTIAAAATARADSDMWSRWRRATHAQTANTTASTPSDTSAVVSDGASHPGLNVSLKEGRNHHGGRVATAATALAPDPNPAVGARDSVALRASSVRLPAPVLVNCSMSGWVQHTTRTAAAAAPYGHTVRRPIARCLALRRPSARSRRTSRSTASTPSTGTSTA